MSAVSLAPICVVHLARATNGIEPLRAFLDSYRTHPAGIAHELLILLKGYSEPLPPEHEDLLGEVPHQHRFIPDRGFDVDAYFHAVPGVRHEVLCFVNSFSEILDDGWLGKLRHALAGEGVGLAGATGSWQSISSSYSKSIRVPAIVLAQYPAWKRLALHRIPLARPAGRLLRRLILHGKVGPFPNYHLRTNAFMIRRDLALAVRLDPVRKKLDAQLFESGRRGLTNQVIAFGKRAVVVGRDGRSYDMREWHSSNTFWRSDQENLLVADNQTRKYQVSPPESRLMYSMHAWGPDADPGTGNRT